jgi:glycosyltransferase involved in cell wall biosynthesis
MTDETLPSVSIIMPIRNEADFIERAIRSVLNNDYPPDKIEVIVVDGRSDDDTQAIVKKIASRDSRVILLENPRRIVPVALNIGLRASHGDIFVPLSGHAEIPPAFIRSSVKCLLEHPDAWVAGGYLKTVSQRYIGKVIAAATQSPLGVGGSKHRLGNFEGWLEGVAFGAHHKWILDKIGYFDEELVRNQDDEFNLRIILAGGKIWMSSSIFSTYYSRSNLSKLWRQYFQYGFWRIRTMQKHHRPGAVRRVVPLLFVLSFITLILAGFFWYGFWWLLLIELVLYVIGLVYGSVSVGRKAGWKYSCVAPVVFAILHFGYGFGSLWGIVRFAVLRGWKMKRVDEFKLSR